MNLRLERLFYLFICLQHALVEAGRIFGLAWKQKISSNSRLLYGSQH